MRSSLLSAAVVTLAAAAICLVSPLSAQAQRKTPTAGGTSKGPYYVVTIVNPPDDPATTPAAVAGAAPTPSNKYEVLDPSTLKTRQTELDDKYKKLLLKWTDERKIDPKTPRPLKPVIKKIQTFNTEEVAKEFADKKNKEEEEKNAADKPKP